MTNTVSANRAMTTHRVVVTAMLCAVSIIATLLGQLIPPVAGFLSYDPKDAVVVIAGFIYGPLTAVIISVISSTIEMLTMSSTGLYGLIMNVLSTCAFAVPAAMLYKKMHNMKGAVLGLVCGMTTFVISADRGYAGHEATNLETQYGVCIDEGPVMNPSTSSIEYAQIWYESVLRNCRVNKTTLHIGKPGRHTVKILCGDAGTVLQKIVLDFGGMKRSYQGPPPTRAE